jgi:hypothetical protein
MGHCFEYWKLQIVNQHQRSQESTEKPQILFSCLVHYGIENVTTLQKVSLSILSSFLKEIIIYSNSLKDAGLVWESQWEEKLALKKKVITM